MNENNGEHSFFYWNFIFDIYGNLLTDKQQQIFKLYFRDDLSLAEISENIDISRQAVHDSIKTSKQIMTDFEKKLGTGKVVKENFEIFSDIKNLLEGLLDDKSRFSEDEIKKIIDFKKVCEEKSNDI